MPILPIDPAAPVGDALRRAAEIIRRGGLVAFPTETVYGLGADALNASAVSRIFAAKGRPATNPLIVHVPDTAAARSLAACWPDTAERLAARWWPGPLTLVVPRRAEVPDAVTAGLEAVALRVPAHPVALALLRESQRPIAAPSANRFTQLSPTTAAHVAASLGEQVDLILDGGPTAVGIESTVVDCSGDVPVLLRPGVLDIDALSAVAGVQLLRPSVTPAENAPRPSPGMHERHYAPRATLLRFEGERIEAAIARAQQAGGQSTTAGTDHVIGAVLWSAAARQAFSAVPQVQVRNMPAEPEDYARLLYATLHDLDAANCTMVLVEQPPIDAKWEGVRDRLQRAGGVV